MIGLLTLLQLSLYQKFRVFISDLVKSAVGMSHWNKKFDQFYPQQKTILAL